jgi:transposase-like protein/IS1 family transposase
VILQSCQHDETKHHGHDRKGNPRLRCVLCGKTWTVATPKLLGDFRVPEETAKQALRLLTEGMSIRATERTTGLHRDTICRLVVFYGEACRRFLDQRMRGLTLEHLEFDEQHTIVGKRQSRIPVDQRQSTYDQGEVYIWTCIDKKTKLMPSFLIGKRSADNARRFMVDVASRLRMPNPHASDAHAYREGGYAPVTQVSTDGFNAYPEAVDLAFGPYVRHGVIIKDYRNAKILYTPSEMVGTKRIGHRGIEGKRELRTITTSHVERLNGTQRLMMKRLNRLTYAFSKKLANLEAAFAIFAAYYNFCWQTRQKDSSKKRPTAAMMAKLAGHVWSFDELFEAVLKPPTHS